MRQQITQLIMCDAAQKRVDSEKLSSLIEYTCFNSDDRDRRYITVNGRLTFANVVDIFYRKASSVIETNTIDGIEYISMPCDTYAILIGHNKAFWVKRSYCTCAIDDGLQSVNDLECEIQNDVAIIEEPQDLTEYDPVF